MKKELKLGKRLLSLALTLAVALTFTAVTPATSYAAINNASLAIAGTAVGTVDGGYKTDVTVPTYTTYEAAPKPFEVYTITFTGTSMVAPTTKAAGGTFTAPAGSADTSWSMLYTVDNTSANATAANIQKDLSNITYYGAGTVTITAKAQTDDSGDTKLSNGHYYKLSTSTKTWANAMREMLTGDTTTHAGYKGYPITVATADESTLLQNFMGSGETKKCIWLGVVANSSGGSIGSSDNGLPGTPYTSGTGGAATNWYWIWGTPEAGQAIGTQNWSDGQPSGTGDANTCVVYAGISNTYKWDDLTCADVSGGTFKLYYITEYSPINSESGGWQNTVDAQYSDKTVSQAFTAADSGKNIYHATINYENGTMTGLESTATYVLSATGEDSKTLTATNGTIKLWSNDESNKYDFTGCTVNVKRTSGITTIHSEDVIVPARKTAELAETDITKYSTKLVVAVKMTVKDDGYQYEYKIGDGDWVTDTDNDGKVIFDKLKSSTTYTITARVKASSTVFVSEPVSVEIKTLPKYGQTSATEEENTTTKDLETAKAEAKSDVTKAASETYDTAEAAEVKAIKEQAEKDIAAATTVTEVNKIKANAQSEIAAIPTAAEKADKKAVQSVTSKKFKATSKKIKKNGKTAVKLTWNAPSGVKLDGYVIYRSTKKSTLGKKVYDTTTKTTYTNAKYLKKGNTYYYKVKGYKVINGEKVYTGWSTRAYRTC